ncbi:phospholipase D-like domain-containing protein [Chryseobacterium arthrosphaerae]|uniref:phospholipase D-like domain-containing protein n=1 Tax=Chryseobacterium arthrosphaerae TaxID=651561 RepID=UPI001F4A9EAF|nr:phospholipase D-like domain-containing protein [Chryseobacterium arthrosphaerae]
MTKGFSTNIEKVLLDNLETSVASIKICVAWFTNKKIIEKLISLKRRRNISIEILIDDNAVNEEYFHKSFKSDLEKSGIEIKQLVSPKFNHNKFSIIDSRILIMGSYNYTFKANKNLESILISDDLKVACFFDRLFRFLTDKSYIDDNVRLLMSHPSFANKIISTYYPFSRKLLSQIENKVHIGYCLTHPNGFYDEISYEAGLIFNSKWIYHKGLKKYNNKKNKDLLYYDDFSNELSQEFSLPIEKSLISSYKIDKINDFNFQTVYESANYNLDKIDFDELVNSAQSIEDAVLEYYQSKFNNITSTNDLTDLINNNVDIIKEDYLWIENFAPFLNDDLVLKIYSKIEDTKAIQRL